jgi:hypothetical protein
MLSIVSIVSIVKNIFKNPGEGLLKKPHKNSHIYKEKESAMTTMDTMTR